MTNEPTPDRPDTVPEPQPSEPEPVTAAASPTADAPAAGEATPDTSPTVDASTVGDAPSGAGTPPPPGPPPPGPPPPPGAGTPPPPGPPPPGPPPGAGFAGRYGLVRPIHGRYLAGVCAAIGRATNTDPVLWRVLAVVLTLFGGIGLLLYLIGWLLIPKEGDAVSPLESLVGKGESATSALTVVVISILAVLVFVFVVSDGFRVAVLGAVAVIAALLLFQRNSNLGRTPAAPTGPPTGPMPPGPGTAPAAPTYPPAAAPYQGTAYQGAAAPYQATATPPFPPPSGFPPPGHVPPSPPYPPQAPVSAAGGYRPPFAPYGPYAGGPPPPPPPVVQAPKPPKPPKERSRLGRIVLSLVCLSLGVVVLLDLATGNVPVSAYFAAMLAIVGLGLLIGAWLGRARWLIVLGLALAAALGISSATESPQFDEARNGLFSNDVLWQPDSVAQLDSTYRVDWADATLDLSRVDFSTSPTPVSVSVAVDVGKLIIILPKNVDADITASVSAGDARVLHEKWGGFDDSNRTVHDNGADGPGGGKLNLDAHIDFGDLEVTR